MFQLIVCRKVSVGLQKASPLEPFSSLFRSDGQEKEKEKEKEKKIERPKAGIMGRSAAAGRQPGGRQAAGLVSNRFQDCVGSRCVSLVLEDQGVVCGDAVETGSFERLEDQEVLVGVQKFQSHVSRQGGVLSTWYMKVVKFQAWLKWFPMFRVGESIRWPSRAHTRANL